MSGLRLTFIHLVSWAALSAVWCAPAFAGDTDLLVVERPASAEPAPAGFLAVLDEAPAWEARFEGLERASVARGDHTAIVRVGDDTWLALDYTDGILGALAVPPDTAHVAIASQERVVVLGGDGRVLLAPTPRDGLRADALVELGSVEAGVEHWDVTPTHAVGCIDGRVLVVDLASGDVETLEPALDDGTRLEGCTAILARADGVTVALGAASRTDGGVEDAVWIADRRGAWRVEPRDGRDLERQGQWIMDRWGGAGSGPRVLATDASWTDQVDADLLDEDHRPGAATHVSDEPAGQFGELRLTLLEPAAPPPADPNDERAATGTGSGGGGTGWGMMGTGFACRGAQCLEPGSTAVSRHAYRFFADGRCPMPAPEALDPPWPDDPDAPIPLPAECEVATMTRLPHVAIVDQTTAALEATVELPAACTTPIELHDAAGLGLLLCAATETDRVQVFARTPRGDWADEGELPATFDGARVHLSVVADAADGTVLVTEAHCAHAASCAGWIRRPVDPGTEGAWATVTPGQDGVVGYRLTGGGSALVVTDTTDGDAASDEPEWTLGGDGHTARIVWSLPGGEPGPVLVDTLRLGERRLFDLRLEGTCLMAQVDAPAGDARPARRWFAVGANGRLVEPEGCAAP